MYSRQIQVWQGYDNTENFPRFESHEAACPTFIEYMNEYNPGWYYVGAELQENGTDAICYWRNNSPPFSEEEEPRHINIGVSTVCVE